MSSANYLHYTLNPNPHRPLITWLLSGCFLIFLMVIIGGITRLTHSGLSITEWNLVMGILPPLSEQHWQELFEKYQQSPEFREIHYFYTIDDFKSIFWWEYIHRLLGRVIGIVFIVPFIYFLLKKKIPSALLPKLSIIFLLGALQGILGWYMVQSGLINEPAVSHYRLAAHLITAFATFGYTLWVAMDLTAPHPQPLSTGEGSAQGLRKLTVVLFSVTIIQIIYGAFVAGLKAGRLYPTYPKMNGEWLAEEIKMAVSDSGWISFFENGAAVQFVHRWLAMLVIIFAVAIWLLSRRYEISFGVQMAIRVVLLVVILQFFLGMLTLINSVPTGLAVLHQTGAFLLFASVLFLLHRLKTV